MSDATWFENRPVHLDTCSRCRGAGAIRRSYALAFADREHARALSAPENAIHALVVGASDVFTACHEAAVIAKRSCRPVAFDFNGRDVVVQPTDDPDQVARQWWVATYGETPEQSYARR